MPTLLGIHPPGLIEAILDDVGIALFVVNKDHRIVMANKAALRLVGLEELPEEGLNFAKERRRYRIEDDQGQELPIENSPLARLLGGEPVEAQDLHVQMPDGAHRWLHVAGHSFSVMGLNGALVVIADETKQVEMRLATEQFKRLESAGVLAGGLAHDFNNMLAVASENAALVLEDPQLPQSTRERLVQMSAALGRGKDLVSRLVQFSRVQDYERRPVQINQVVEATLQLVRPMLGSNIRLYSDFHPGLPMVEAAPAAIEQVLVNLILNALDAMPEGGQLTVETGLAGPEAVSHHQGERPERFVSISVADNGIGIPDSLQAMIFEPFFTTKPPGKGAGLGLATAYGIIRQHHGSIKVQSQPGSGTRFTIFLPVEKTTASNQEAA